MARVDGLALWQPKQCERGSVQALPVSEPQFGSCSCTLLLVGHPRGTQASKYYLGISQKAWMGLKFRGSELLAALHPFLARSRRDLRMSLNSWHARRHVLSLSLGARFRNWPRPQASALQRPWSSFIDISQRLA